MKSPAALWTIFLAVLTDLIGFGIVLPLLPFYASLFKASAVSIGFLYSIYSMAQLVFSPLWGGISDRIGRRPIMLMSTLGASLAYILFGLSHSLWVLFLSRLIAGIMGGNISTAQAYVADVTSPEERAKGMGLIGAAFGIGFTLGPLIASVLIHPAVFRMFGLSVENRYAIPGFFAAFLSGLSFLLVLFKLPETVSPPLHDHPKVTRSGIFSKTFWLSIRPGSSPEAKVFPLLIGCVFLLSFAQASLYSAFPLFCQVPLDLSAEQVGWFYAYMGVIAVLIQGGLIRILVKKFAEENIFLAGSILMAAGFLLIPFARSASFLTLFVGLMAIGGSLNGPTLNSLISKFANPSQIGATMGTSQGIAGLGRVLGPPWGGFLYGWGYQLPFLATAFSLFITVFAGFKLRQGRQTASS